MNAVEIEAAISELALQPFDAAEFPFAFLAAFGNKDTALPATETTVVQRMYSMFIHHGKSENEIADILNFEKIFTDLGRKWTRCTVNQVLTNEKYIGNNVYNRVSFKLKKTRVVNPEEIWVRSDRAFKPIVDIAVFKAAQHIIAERNKRYSDSEMLDGLNRLWKEKGWLSGVIINEANGIPLSSAYRSRFGSLLRAYELIGYTPHRDYQYVELNRVFRAMHPGIVNDIVGNIVRLGGKVFQDPATDLLTINDEITVSIVIARCFFTPAGSRRWRLRFDTGLRPDITVACRMDVKNNDVLDYYLLPRFDIESPRIKLAEENAVFLDAYRFDSLTSLFNLTERIKMKRAA